MSYDSATRHVLAQRLRDTIAAGASLRAACTALGLPPATGKLWLDTLAARGDLADARRERSGRRPVCPLTDAEAAALRSLVLDKGMTEESAIRAFPGHPACTAETRAFIRLRIAASHKAHRTEAKKERWPDSLRRACHITAGDAARFYGRDARNKSNIKTIRNLDIIMPDGRTMQARPHTVWMFDDYSTNQPYYLEYAAGKFRLCRQILAGYDLFTGGFLCFLHVGREKDAYTGGDCCRVIHLAMESHGTRPDIIILERGRWESNAVRGLDMGNGRRWGAISECGVIVDHTWDSNGKAELEGMFRNLQVELTGGADIGNTRGLHERESANLLAVNKGTRDPRDCGFLSLTESEEAHYRAAALLHARRRERRVLGYASPDELHAEFPVTPRPLAAADRWLFMPHKQEATVGSISAGLVGCKVDGVQHLFVVNGVADHVHLDNGHKVFIAFDPQRPQIGCVVANADTSTRNRDAHRLGQLLLGGTAGPMAMPWETQARLDLRTPEEKQLDQTQHWKQRDAAIKAADTSFAAILPQGKRGLRVITRQIRDADTTVRDMVIGSEHDTTDAAAELTALYRGEHHSNASENANSDQPENSASADSADCPRAMRNANAPSSDVPEHPRLKSRPAVLVPAADEDAELAALESAAMAAAGLSLV